MGWACGTYGGGEMLTGFLVETPEGEKNQLEGLGVCGG